MPARSLSRTYVRCEGWGRARTGRYDRTVSELAPSRYRCAACGNLTRFDVTSTRRTRAFHHYTVGGDLTVEDEVVLAEDVEEVSCRWCNSAKSVAPVSDDDATEQAVV